MISAVDTLLEFFRSNFYWIDFTIGGLTPILVYFLYKTGRIDKFIWILFWVGCAIGLTWEVPIFTLNEFSETNAVTRYITPLPVNFMVIMISHTLWDGGLFLLGVWLCHLICGPPLFARFRLKEFLVLIVWGQVSELWVELTATVGEAWAFIPRPWNPSLFKFNGHDITLMIQLVWLAAPILFYFIAMRLRKKYPDKREE